MRSEGDAVLVEGAVLDVSGGSLRYLDGNLSTTKLVSDGKVYDISDASPDLIYQSVFDRAPQRSFHCGSRKSRLDFDHVHLRP